MTLSKRKIWVKRPDASATLVQIQEDDLVDDVRDTILRKYANSLGRNFDAPDVTLKIVSRDQERILGPDESIMHVLEKCFPKGQRMDDALVIDVLHKGETKTTPQSQSLYHESRPTEAGSEYFPPMPIPSSPRLSHQHPPSMSVLTTGHLPALPSPGRRTHRERPRSLKQNTAPSTFNATGVPTSNGQIHLSAHPHPQPLPRSRSNASEHIPVLSSFSLNSSAPSAPSLPTPPAAQIATEALQIKRAATPPRVKSPSLSRPLKKNWTMIGDHPSLRIGMLKGGVPPINVLIVEDNNINLKLLEAFMKRLKVRWQTAVNGKIAVDIWKTGGFHLVLMDIQLPVMSGLEATREIRRLERENGIGFFSSSASSTAPQEIGAEPKGEDKLPSDALFKSPVIIVALTASSLQSDRHEALAAGCNDFLTKVSLS